MCGIFGINKQLNKEILAEISRTLSHRGPDEGGTFITDNFTLSHNRLKVIDLETGKQPIFNEDKSKCIIFNGEIFNYKELKNELLKHGHNFSTKTDTEVVLHLFEEQGIDSLSSFNGQFAFAVLDLSARKITLARDRLGIIPLYYYYNGSDFIFASEIGAILRSKAVKKCINKDAILKYFLFRYNFGEESIIQGIKKLLPGHYLEFNFETCRMKNASFWDFSFFKDNQYHCDSLLLRELISSSVKYRMISDVPIGVFLSGGLDSSVVAFLMNHYSDQPIKTFSVGFNLSTDETSDAKKFAMYINSDHEEIVVRPTDYYLLPEVVAYFDEPIGDIIILPTYLLAKSAAQQVKVVLTGEGADEIFGGYIHHQAFYYLYQYWNRLPSRLKKNVTKFFSFLPMTLFNKLFFYPEKLKANERTKVLNALKLLDTPELLFKQLVSLITKDELITLLKPDFSQYTQEEVLLDRKNPFRSLVEADLHNWLPDYTLLKIDRVTMANSLESRVPFLDHRVVEYAWGCQDADFIKGLQVKHPLREAFKRDLPLEKIIQRKKGFYFPYFKIFEPEFKEFLTESMLSGKSEIFEENSLKKTITAFDNNMSLTSSKKFMAICILRFWEKYWYQKH